MKVINFLTMKKISKFIIVLAIGATSLNACIDNEPTLWKEALVEFDATVLNAPALGKTYPLLVRVPPYGFAAPSTGATINRSSGNIVLRINFVGAHRPNDETIQLAVVTSETTAQENVHYTIPSSVVIPAGTSYAELTISVLDPGAGPAPVDLVLELVGNESIKPSENYKTLGIRIAQN